MPRADGAGPRGNGLRYEKMPPPIIEPTTSAVSTGNDRLEDFSPSVLIDA
jgi:hypothetical protein